MKLTQELIYSSFTSLYYAYCFVLLLLFDVPAVIIVVNSEFLEHWSILIHTKFNCALYVVCIQYSIGFNFNRIKSIVVKDLLTRNFIKYTTCSWHSQVTVVLQHHWGVSRLKFKFYVQIEFFWPCISKAIKVSY